MPGARKTSQIPRAGTPIRPGRVPRSHVPAPCRHVPKPGRVPAKYISSALENCTRGSPLLLKMKRPFVNPFVRINRRLAMGFSESRACVRIARLSRPTCACRRYTVKGHSLFKVILGIPYVFECLIFRATRIRQGWGVLKAYE